MPVAKRSAKPGLEVGQTRCGIGACDPQSTQGLKAPAPRGTHELVRLDGPGLFISAIVTKQGGASGLTFVKLEIDGRVVADLSYAAARNFGLTAPNPYGLQLLTGVGIESFTMGWPVPLTYKRSLRLSATVNEAGVVQMIGRVIHAASG